MLKINDENSIRLIIKKCFADEIKAGTKKREYRAESPFYLNRLYIRSDAPKDGYDEVMIDRKKRYLKVKDIRFIVFQVGYTKDTFTCECTGFGYIRAGGINTLTENDILYPENQKENPAPLYDLIKDEFTIDEYLDDEWFLVFSLGNIIE